MKKKHGGGFVSPIASSGTVSTDTQGSPKNEVPMSSEPSDPMGYLTKTKKGK